MTLSIIIDIADGAWTCALPDLETLADAAARNAIARTAPDYLTANAEIGLSFGDDDFVRGLNKQYRGKDKPTNVLSFPPAAMPRDPDAPLVLGDIVLGLQTIIREAEDAGKSLADHTQHLIIHGVLHLLGHDHEGENQANLMESLEIEILDAMNIANPYIIPIDAD